MRAKFGNNGMVGIGSDSSYNLNATTTRTYFSISISCLITIAGGSLLTFFFNFIINEQKLAIYRID